MNDAHYATNWFAMLHLYINEISPDTEANCLNALEALANLDFPNSKSAHKLLSEACGLTFYLCNLDVNTIVAMMVIKMMEKDEHCTSIQGRRFLSGGM